MLNVYINDNGGNFNLRMLSYNDILSCMLAHVNLCAMTMLLCKSTQQTHANTPDWNFLSTDWKIFPVVQKL